VASHNWAYRQGHERNGRKIMGPGRGRFARVPSIGRRGPLARPCSRIGRLARPPAACVQARAPRPRIHPRLKPGRRLACRARSEWIATRLPLPLIAASGLPLTNATSAAGTAAAAAELVKIATRTIPIACSPQAIALGWLRAMSPVAVY